MNMSVEHAGRRGPPDRPPLLWRHKQPRSTFMWAFKTLIESKYNEHLEDYEALRRWSIANLADFWMNVWYFTGILSSKFAPFTETFDEHAPMFPRPSFFLGVELNFAENLLFPACHPREDSLAIIAATEVSRENISWKELRIKVRRCTAALSILGVRCGDRVTGYVANHANAVVAMLAATSLGAIWTSMSPDTGVTAVLDRLQQVGPVVLFCDATVMYNSKIYQCHDKIKEIALGLQELRAVVVFETAAGQPFGIDDIRVSHGRPWKYEELLAACPSSETQEFKQLPADHPVYILYSSGTTGKPKCMVHGAAGTLIQHKKEHQIHCDIHPSDRLFYFTTTTWMMWHWLVSGLASGATIVLYDGSPFKSSMVGITDDLAMPFLIDELSVSHFGTSAKYLSILEQKKAMPKASLSLESLKAIYSTGSPLSPSTFDYVYRAFGPDINLGSISGGTDIVSCFGVPSPISPVFSGEIQVRGLGMAVEAWDINGKSIVDEPGDLVCVKPFPCQPIMFWGKDGEQTYKKSYFDTFPGIWHHGDFIKINSATGGMVMLGRSDGILNPSGVRFGSAEIYNIILKHYREVEDALCVGRKRETDPDETVVLFVKMINDKCFSKDLGKRIQETVRVELSGRHVPGIVDECPEIPVTVNGKKVEVAVKQILCGASVKTSASVANVSCLEWYSEWAKKH